MRYADRINEQIQALGQVPMPSEDAIVHSERLYQSIVAQIQNNSIPFNEFMHQVLYAPGLGYYSAGAAKIGPEGDFITAPEISPLFGASIGVQIAQVLNLGGGSVLEFGAGTGKLALSILRYLREQQRLPTQYYILEPSPDLQQRQKELLSQEIPELMDIVQWLDALPESFTGVVVANEVLDAMPVHVFKTNGEGIQEQYIGCSDSGDFVTEYKETKSEELMNWWQKYGQKQHLPDGYLSEVNLNIGPWLEAIEQMMESGLILLIDYGFPESEYYLPERSTGTLKCHYRHHHHDDPLKLPGLQDVTAHVDFTAVAEAGHGAGLDVLGYVHQGGFLTSCGIVQMAEKQLSGDLKQQMKMSQQIKPLIMPEEMGELFKVIALGKNLDTVDMGGLIGFSYLDLRWNL